MHWRYHSPSLNHQYVYITANRIMSEPQHFSNINMWSYQYRNSHYKTRQPQYCLIFLMGISLPEKMTSYWSRTKGLSYQIYCSWHHLHYCSLSPCLICDQLSTRMVSTGPQGSLYYLQVTCWSFRVSGCQYNTVQVGIYNYSDVIMIVVVS